jgi:hypothetical protein
MLKLKYEQKYLKYKNKYLHIKSQIGGSESYLWYVDDIDRKFSLVLINEKENQKFITTAYLLYLWNTVAINTESLSIKGPLDVRFWNHKLKFVVFDHRKLKAIINSLTLLECMYFMENFLFNSFKFKNIDLISIGCEDDYFEKLCEQIFGINILCFRKATFDSDIQTYNKSKKKQHSILICISSETETNKAIEQLKPLAFFSIDIFDILLFDKLIRDVITIGEQKYIKLYFSNEKEIYISLWINCTLYESYTDTFKYIFYKPQTLSTIKSKA